MSFCFHIAAILNVNVGHSIVVTHMYFNSASVAQ